MDFIKSGTVKVKLPELTYSVNSISHKDALGKKRHS